MADTEEIVARLARAMNSPWRHWWNLQAWAGIWLNPIRWVRARVQRGSASWCGRFVIVYSPVNWSLALGRCAQGLWLYRWTERGHDIIRMGKA